jgi:hypothetical protein
MKTSLMPGLAFTFHYRVPEDKTVPACPAPSLLSTPPQEVHHSAGRPRMREVPSGTPAEATGPWS